jgi:hypothetical protein
LETLEPFNRTFKENEMRHSTNRKTSLRAAAITLAATLLCATAHAEYRCATPEQLSNAEKQACELARQDTPDALIHFVNRTKGTYNLYIDDYVSKADGDRWELAKHRQSPGSPEVARAKNPVDGTSKAE